ncbi:hypothetical protein DY000_02005871 [Brassica cretica]|uniref:RNase H type-1 domain-containing protein n=1 Tax=Brassica cretica TaxID=69181 RepID=A0ABQ7C6F8_BRACR|nr:hypothetical protein DY000_02005871 [Brassica cretica]
MVVASALVAEAPVLQDALESAETQVNSFVIALKDIFHDIGMLRSSFTSISFKFIPRVFNVAADGLAKAALFSVLNSSIEIVNSAPI